MTTVYIDFDCDNYLFYMSFIHSLSIASQNLAVWGPEARGLHGPVSQGPRWPLHKWPPVKSAPDPRCDRGTSTVDEYDK